jgi:membrane protease YdiL (CAAX protease family)
MKTKTITVYLFFAFAMAWILWGIIALMGGDLSSLYASIALPVSMFAPAAAVLVTKRISGGTRVMEASFKPKFKGNLHWYLLSWLLIVVLVVLGMILYFRIFPDQYDPNMGWLRVMLATNRPGTDVTDSVVQSTFYQLIIQTLTLSVITTTLLTLGEEIGWRGFLFPAVRSRTTEVKAHVLCGIIWGLWHAPVILIGYNFGTEYWGFPWLGILVMCLTSTAMGIVLSYVTGKTGSIWPAALAHGTINSVASGLPMCFLREEFTGYYEFFYTSIILVPVVVLAIALLIMVSTRKNVAYDEA